MGRDTQKRAPRKLATTQGRRATEEDRPHRVATVVAVKVVEPFTLDLRFADGTEVRKDMRAFVRRAPGILARLRDKRFFARVRVNKRKGTIEWPGEIDFCPEDLANRHA